jgi:hypothetical protein
VRPQYLTCCAWAESITQHSLPWTEVVGGLIHKQVHTVHPSCHFCSFSSDLHNPLVSAGLENLTTFKSSTFSVKARLIASHWSLQNGSLTYGAPSSITLVPITSIHNLSLQRIRRPSYCRLCLSSVVDRISRRLRTPALLWWWFGGDWGFPRRT